MACYDDKSDHKSCCNNKSCCNSNSDSKITMRPDSEYGSKYRFEETPLCHKLMECLQKQEKELSKMLIIFGADKNKYNYCTFKSDCSGCIARELKPVLPEDEIFFTFRILKDIPIERAMSNPAIMDLRRKLKNVIDLRSCASYVSTTINRVPIYYVLNELGTVAYNILNKDEPSDLIDHMHEFRPDLFTSQSVEPSGKEIFFEKSDVTEVFYNVHLTFPSSVIKSHMETIIDALTKLDFDKEQNLILLKE